MILVEYKLQKYDKKAMEQIDIFFKKKYEILIMQGYLHTRLLLNNGFFEQFEIASLWRLFVKAGYLTVQNDGERNRYRLAIPNEEVQKEFMSLKREKEKSCFLCNILYYEVNQRSLHVTFFCRDKSR